jgi:hypothetical protein
MEAITVKISSPCGGVNVFLVGDKVHAETLELFEGVDQRLSRACQAVTAPHQDHVDLTLFGCCYQRPVLRAILLHTTGILNVFPYRDKAPMLGIRP